MGVYGLVALALLAFRVDLRLILAATPWWVVPAFMAFASVGFAVRVARWLLLARAAGLGVRNAGLATVYVGGFLMNLTPGRIGELWRSWVLWHVWRLRYRRTLPLLICDRLLDLCALLLLGSAGLGLGSAGPGVAWLATPCLVAAAVLVTLMALPGWARRATKAVWAATNRRRPRLFALLLSVCRNVALLLEPAHLVKLLSLSLLAWSLEAIALHVLMPAIGGELPLRAALAALGVGNVAGAITFLPGGIGSQELTMTLFIAGVAGNSTAHAMAMVGIMRVSTLWYSAALGLPFFLYLSRRGMGSGA
ncbi:MAG: flippase-like domain-containing protein [Deltaproteobacteria bacterium]|nr:flippase-like domain-containing protein [Deltaproteobacteria bacterium]